MPGDDGLGPDEDEMAPPIVAETAGQDPNQPVAPVDGRSLARRACQDGELVAQQQVLEGQVAAATEGGAK